MYPLSIQFLFGQVDLSPLPNTACCLLQLPGECGDLVTGDKLQAFVHFLTS